MSNLNARSLQNLEGVHPDIKRLMIVAAVDCPIGYVVTEGARDVKRQQELFAQGRTKPGKVVTNCDGIKKKSNHQPKEDGLGYAVDLYPCINGRVEVNDAKSLKIIGDHIKIVAKKLGINISWGGDWKFIDLPHYELLCKN